MQPATVQVCEDPSTGAEIIQYERAPGCREAAYSVTHLDFGAATLVRRPGYAASLSASSSHLFLGLGGWLGPDGGGFDILKAGVSLRRTLRQTWDLPLSFGASTLVFDQNRGTRSWGVFAPFAEISLLFGTRTLMLGPSASVQYRWMFNAQDAAQFTIGLSVSVNARESLWSKPPPSTPPP